MRAFEGKTTASTIAAILAGEPQPISTIKPMSSPALEAVDDGRVSQDRRQLRSWFADDTVSGTFATANFGA